MPRRFSRCAPHAMSNRLQWTKDASDQKSLSKTYSESFLKLQKETHAQAKASEFWRLFHLKLSCIVPRAKIWEACMTPTAGWLKEKSNLKNKIIHKTAHSLWYQTGTLMISAIAIICSCLRQQCSESLALSHVLHCYKLSLLINLQWRWNLKEDFILKRSEGIGRISP